MKRTYKYALSAVLGLSLSVPALAQTGFPDVKDSHWAADSVNRLKLSGLVHGFKDGEYKGDRTMTRYEMASAVYAIYAKLVCFNEEVDKKIKALEAKINSIKPGEAPSSPDLTDIRQAISDMRNDVGTIKAWGSDLAQLKKMTAAYSNDLKSIGMDVKEMQKNIADVQSRVAKLEANPGGIKISGDANFWMAGSQTANDSRGVVNQDGAFIPSNINGGAGFDNMIMLHEFGINIEDKTAKAPYKAEFVIANTISDGAGGFGDQTYDATTRSITSGNDTVWIHELTGTYRPFNMTFGRQGVKLNKFVLQRPDMTSFYSNKRWDDHTFRMDGVSMKFANDNGSLFMGQTSNATNTFGTILQPIILATMPVFRIAGGTYDFKFGGDKGKISASYVNFDGFAGVTNFLTRGENEPPPPPPENSLTRMNVYGVDLNYDLGGLQLELGGGKSVGYGVADLQQNGLQSGGSDTQHLDTLIDSANGRWDASLTSQSENHMFKVTYRNVETNYFAPGDWGRVSIFHNLTDTKAYNATAVVMATKRVGVHGFYEKGEAIAGIGDYSMWRAGANTWITPKWTVDFTMEDTNFHNGFQGIADGSSSKFRTVRLAYDAGQNRTVNIFAQQSLLDGIATLPRTQGKGVLYGFQYSLKF